MTVPKIDKSAGPFIEEIGRKMVKLPMPVFIVEIEDEEGADVETAEGVMHGAEGDFLIWDPVTERVWPNDADYVANYYTDVIEGDADPEGVLQALGDIKIPEGAGQAQAHLDALIEEIKSFQAQQDLADQPVSETDPLPAGQVPDPATQSGTNEPAPLNQDTPAGEPGTKDKAGPDDTVTGNGEPEPSN